jgi:hypothetical protein
MRKRTRSRLSLAASIAALTLAGVGVAGFSVYQTSQPSAEAAAYTPSKPSIPKPWPVMAIVGDSFAMDRIDSWANRTAFCTGHRMVMSGAGGSGFWNDGKGVRYGDPSRIAAVTREQPEIIILESAYNDSFRAEEMSWRLSNYVRDTIKAYQKAAPQAKIVVFGPIWAIQPPTVGIKNNREVLATISEETGVTYVDGTGLLPTAEYTGKDLKHPSPLGHQQITSRVVSGMLAAGLPGASASCTNLT